jgi:acid phosphatase
MLSRKSLVLFISCSLLALCSTALYATEPQNLQITKDILVNYHDSGAYEEDIKAVTYKAQNYLSAVVAEQQKQNSKEKLAVVFDIDETVLSNYDYMQKLNFGGKATEIINLIEDGKSPAIPATLALYQQAKSENIHIFFITGRTDTAEIRKNTADNLHTVGFDKYDGLILKPVNYKEATVSTYKTAARKKITDQGYHIVLNIGDQMSDLNGGYADRTYKLPDPYYYIP